MRSTSIQPYRHAFSLQVPHNESDRPGLQKVFRNILVCYPGRPGLHPCLVSLVEGTSTIFLFGPVVGVLSANRHTTGLAEFEARRSSGALQGWLDLHRWHYEPSSRLANLWEPYKDVLCYMDDTTRGTPASTATNSVSARVGSMNACQGAADDPGNILPRLVGGDACVEP